MTTSLMILQAVISILLIITVLLQFGKGAEAGLMTAAGSESLMSSSTRGNVMTKVTAVLAVIFIGNSILLARIQDSKFQKSLLDSEAPVSRPLNSDAAQAPKKASSTSVDTSPAKAETAAPAPSTTPTAAPTTTTPAAK